MRANLTIAITKMTYPVNNTDESAFTDNSLCPMPDNFDVNSSSENDNDFELLAVSSSKTEAHEY